MTDDHDQLIATIRTLADRPAPAGSVPVDVLLHRGRRARRTRRALRVALGAGAVALAVTVAAVVAPPSPAAPPAGPAVSSSPAPVESHTGYHVAVTYTVHSGRYPDHDVVQTFQGATDPANRRASLTGKEFPQEIRILGDDEYVRLGTRGWRAGGALVGPRGTLPLAQLMAVEPQQLLAELRGHGTVTRTGDSPGPTGGSETYTFSYVSTNSDYTGETGAVGNTVTGSVVLVGGRYRTVTIRTVLVAPNLGDADPDPITRSSVLEFSDYGITVPVERPAVQPVAPR